MKMIRILHVVKIQMHKYKKEFEARRTRRGKCSAKWHECHFAQENSRRVRMIFAEEILICAAEENIYRV